MPKLIIVADDLTGALDSSSTFARRGAKVSVVVSPVNFEAELLSDADIVVVSTNSREVPEALAASIMRGICQSIDTLSARGQHPLIFKKIDSRLKGHIAIETECLRKENGTIILCPAVPRLKRVVENGMVSGAGITKPISIQTAIAGLDAETPDAQTDADLNILVADALPGTLFAGAAGLAEALAQKMFGQPISATYTLPSPALFAIGSRDPVTAAQLTSIPFIEAPNGCVQQHRDFHENLSIFRLTQGKPKVDSVTTASLFAKGIAQWVQQTNVRALFACGGETSAAIFGRLGINTLDVIGEILPGVPISATTVPGIGKLIIVTKSGGFGEPDTLIRLRDMISPAKTNIVEPQKMQRLEK